MDRRIQKAQISASGASIIVPPGIKLKPTVRGQILVGNEGAGALEGEQEVLVTFRIEYVESTGAFEVAAFGVDRLDNALEISGAFFRTVRVHAIANAGILAALPAWAFELAQLRHLRFRGGLRSFPDFRPTDDEALLLTGLIYRIAEISGDNPALAVADAIGLKQRTATNWIQRARVAGYMTSTEHGAAARRLAKVIYPFWSQHGREEWEASLAAAGITQDDVRAIVEREIARMAQEADGGGADGYG
ncbi:hypothetical protein ACH3VR_09165 [Microbacterium sp. B2969]|uniref:Uncharacterized protein n=1 Tax=Microbacterium alkaliflavum TaxID=3248839 RepID=A0ABW7Q7Z2_9MICO